MILLFDMGNSRCKWAIVDKEGTFKFAQKGAWDNQTFDGEYWQSELTKLQLQQAEAALQIDAIVVSSVASEQAKQSFSECCLAVLQIKPQFASSQASYQSALPVEKGARRKLVNSYDKPLTLGVDRWLAMIAVFEQEDKAFMVFDMGTAITLDVVDAKGQHLGGHIIPGQQLMQNSLLGSTGKIAWGATQTSEQEIQHNQQQLLADNTLAAIELGALEAAAAYTDSMIRRLEQQHQVELIVFTGGGAPVLMDYLQSNHPSKLHYRAELVLQGLYYWYKSL